jgi:hypothetical protein
MKNRITASTPYLEYAAVVVKVVRDGDGARTDTDTARTDTDGDTDEPVPCAFCDSINTQPTGDGPDEDGEIQYECGDCGEYFSA